MLLTQQSDSPQTKDAISRFHCSLVSLATP
jgi:hypothetical protein